MPVICAWCPTFDRTAPENAGASHGMCPTCYARELAKMDAEDAARAAQETK